MIRNNKKRENIQAKDKAGYSAARVAEQIKRSETKYKEKTYQEEDYAGHRAARVAEQNK